MKRFVMSLAGAALLATVVGCGGGGIEEGMPTGDTTKQGADIHKMVDPTGTMGTAAVNKAAAANKTATAPGGTAPDAKK